MPKVNNTKIIDIHGLTASEAKERIEREIARVPSVIKKIVVIHGYHKGNVLQETVRKQICAVRIVDISPSFSNEGETIIYLR